MITLNFLGILPKEKFLEPKTVRIVKRESTERKKDRFSTPGNGLKKSSATGSGSDSNLAYVAEDEMESDDRSDIENDSPENRTASLPKSYARYATRRTSEPLPSSAGSLIRPSNLPLRKGQTNFKSKVSL